MFKLQRIEIIGFKSFADRTELAFTGDGITAVVGPNGCGKSNVADAIAWVLGEQRAKQLRGGEMKDVIFQGTRTRKPGGMAEVVLHLLRDESEPDAESIDDIDSQLEQFDSDRPDLVSTDAPAKLLTDGDANAAGGDQVTDANGETAPDEASAGEPSAGETAMEKARARRRWRPAARAFDFAPGEIVSVTRRLYRSGESEYLLNNRACRLRDIQDLFSGTGLAGAHYAIIEQGRIGQILSAKPIDRRTLIEEAAGITKFRVRQRAAEARLDSARANLNRVTDIVSEVERQVGSLRRQAQKARRYTVLRDELRALVGDVYRADYHALTHSINEITNALALVTEEEARLTDELAASEQAARDATTRARATEEQLARARAEAAEAALQRDRRRREHAYQQEQLEALEARASELTRDSEAITTRLTSLRDDAGQARANEQELHRRLDESAELLRVAEAAYAESTRGVFAAEKQIETLRAEHLQHTAAAERLAEIGRQLEAATERLRLQADGLAKEGERATLAHDTAREQAARLAEETAAAVARVTALTAERATASAAARDARETSVAAAAEHARVQSDFERVRHRLHALTELDSHRAHYSEAVQRLFSGENKNFTHAGTLADVLRVDPAYERAVESVFGDYLQSVIVPTPEDALRAAAWLRADGLGRANFLVAGLNGASVDEEQIADSANAKRSGKNGKAASKTSRGSKDATTANSDTTFAAANGDAPRLGALLGAPPEIVLALDRTLSREMRARIAVDLDEAMSGALSTGEPHVTAAGEFVIGGALLGAGGAGVPGVQAGLLAFKREMRELETEASELEAAAVFAEGRASDAARRVAEAEDAVVTLNEAIGRAEREQVACEMNDAALRGDIERAERHLRVVAADAERLDTEINELAARRATAGREAETAEAARQDVSERVTAAADELTERRRAAAVENERLSEQRAAAATAAERRRAAAQELRRTEGEIADLERRLTRGETEIAESRARATELRRSLDRIAGESVTTEHDEAHHARTLARLENELQQAREQADTEATDYSERTRGVAAVRDRRHALDVQQTATQARLDYLHEACSSELNRPLEELAGDPDAAPVADDFDLESARARVEEARARLDNIGAVNMMALEELTEQEERFTFLTTQRQDITDGIRSTEEALREIKRRSRDRFRSAFDEINRNFGELFNELFGGGRGEMNLLDTEDVLESGIDIIAQPPGKRLQSVLLLSGGEKAMTALALVLAIFRYRPSPFCLLDEVDAPLDEANVNRFAAKIVEMSERTQFIVITHNKRTMESARALYGVTMQEAGVSKLVSAKFE